ncbi:hypothetical protein [Rheinheimera sp. F8]|uniref:hypothetical protein n=1 Tax=Rheinheimera sp. F8 TaxID=1763998 RepID=UPI00074486AD|nr:hypothetical protein [Rheinheimera sp. F8]ALZ74599.1 hypothetical protein ATY27_01700 [Rheinheimera sp. F8]
MSVSVAAIAKSTVQFEANELQAFRAFIDVSKALKGAVQTQQDEAAATFNEMQAALDSLQQPVPASGQALITVLESDAAYISALQAVTLLPADVNQPPVVLAYMQAFLQQVEKTMAQQADNADSAGGEGS